MSNSTNSMRSKSYANQLQGQAGVWAVASQLALRGHVPCFPGVDYGFDLVMDNGLRLQVKTSSLRTHPGYPSGAYAFDFRQSFRQHSLKRNSTRYYRDYSKIADFAILWGVDENRFWIVPCCDIKGAAWFGSKLYRHKPGSKKYWMPNRLRSFEDRWDLLDVNLAVEKAVMDSVQVQAP